MPRSHGNNRLKYYGAEVDKLFNDRYRVEIRCEVTSQNQDWYYANRDGLWKDFADAYNLPLTVDEADVGWEPDQGEPYPDLCLVDTSFGYIPNKETPIVTFVYETLTTTFTQEAADKVDYELNGLRRVTRSVIAKDGATYSKTVGTSTISHNQHGYGAATLTLGSAVEDAKNQSEGGFVRIIETWVEAGTLSVNTQFEEEGVRRVTTTFLVTEGTTVGPIISRNTNNVDGLKTITVTTLQKNDGTALVVSGDNLVSSTPIFTAFNYPGIATLDTDAPFSYVLRHNFKLTEAPTQCKVRATVYTLYSDNGAISTSLEVYQGAAGIWSPNNWATISVDAASQVFEQAIGVTNALRGYRSTSNSVSGTVNPDVTSGVRYSYNGQTISDSLAIDYSIEIDQGPPNPIGQKWVLDIQSGVAFEDVDGNVFYKKRVVVTDVIPSQISLTLPYDG